MSKQPPSLAQQEAYESAYYYYFQALELLTQDAETQCERLNFFNVAWEIVDDINRGAEQLTGLPGGSLTDAQRQGILELAGALNNVPKSVLFCTNSREGHLRSMAHPCWDALRQMAANLVERLSSETRKNAEFFRLQQATQAPDNA